MGLPTFKTARLSYDKLLRLALDCEAQIVELREQADAARTDLYFRRLDMIKAGKKAPSSEQLLMLPGWPLQQRREQVAADNRAIDEQVARAPGTRGQFVLPT